jgi:hypothetical protein
MKKDYIDNLKDFKEGEYYYELGKNKDRILYKCTQKAKAGYVHLDPNIAGVQGMLQYPVTSVILNKVKFRQIDEMEIAEYLI